MYKNNSLLRRFVLSYYSVCNICVYLILLIINKLSHYLRTISYCHLSFVGKLAFTLVAFVLSAITILPTICQFFPTMRASYFIRVFVIYISIHNFTQLNYLLNFCSILLPHIVIISTNASFQLKNIQASAIPINPIKLPIILIFSIIVFLPNIHYVLELTMKKVNYFFFLFPFNAFDFVAAVALCSSIIALGGYDIPHTSHITAKWASSSEYMKLNLSMLSFGFRYLRFLGWFVCATDTPNFLQKLLGTM